MIDVQYHWSAIPGLFSPLLRVTELQYFYAGSIGHVLFSDILHFFAVLLFLYNLTVL